MSGQLRRSPRKRATTQQPIVNPLPPASPTSTLDEDLDLAVLYQPNILYSLPRPNLVTLCNRHSLQTSGTREVLANRLLKHGEFLKLPPLLLEEEKAGGVSGNWSLLDVTQGEARDHQSSEEGDAEMKERSLTDASSSDSAEEDENEEEDDEDDEDESAEEQEAGGIVEVHTTIEHRPPSLGIPSTSSPPKTLSAILADAAALEPPPSPNQEHPFVFGSKSAENYKFKAASPTISPTGVSSNLSASSAGVTAILAELNSRVAQKKLDGTLTPTTVDFSTFGVDPKAPITHTRDGTGGQKSSTFDRKHNKHFEKMDSIATHYAAKRPISMLEASTSGSTNKRVHSTLTPSASSRNHLSQSTSSAAERSVKRVKTALAPIPDRTIVDGLRTGGWVSQGPSGDLRQSVKNGGIKSRRELELARARRKSGIGAIGVRGRRRSLVVGR